MSLELEVQGLLTVSSEPKLQCSHIPYKGKLQNTEVSSHAEVCMICEMEPNGHVENSTKLSLPKLYPGSVEHCEINQFGRGNVTKKKMYFHNYVNRAKSDYSS